METRGAYFGFEVSMDGDQRGLFRIRGEHGWRPAGLVSDSR
jgi:hypothetical protein